MFATITRRFDRELDASLRDATRELARRACATSRARTRRCSIRRSSDSRAYAVPARHRRARALNGDAATPWIQAFARDARARAAAHATHHTRDGRANSSRATPSAFDLADGQRVVAVASADEIELEDRYASLIAAFGGAAFVALVLVAAGGWFLARQSTAPVERAIAHMRRFMADAAHELRTPLTVVRSRAEVALQRRASREEYRARRCAASSARAERLGSIVEDLLMLARADAGERPIERRRVFLDDVTLDAAEAARVIADRKSVRLEVDDFEEAAVDGDPALLRQLVMILLDNAIKFTAAGGVVRVGVRSPSDERRR